MFSKPGRAKTRTNPSKIEKQAKIRHKAVMLSALQFIAVNQVAILKLRMLTQNFTLFKSNSSITTGKSTS